MKKLIWASGLLLLLTVTACQNKHKQGSGNLEHKTLTEDIDRFFYCEDYSGICPRV